MSCSVTTLFEKWLNPGTATDLLPPTSKHARNLKTCGRKRFEQCHHGESRPVPPWGGQCPCGSAWSPPSFRFLEPILCRLRESLRGRLRVALRERFQVIKIRWLDSRRGSGWVPVFNPEWPSNLPGHAASPRIGKEIFLSSVTFNCQELQQDFEEEWQAQVSLYMYIYTYHM